ncbi:MAG: retroviral-like aspartic protease family protein [Oscillospiraceae bacterium]|nr:retroviral-like aspartic protease family protein [Oscillospiraceae bacterium]
MNKSTLDMILYGDGLLMVEVGLWNCNKKIYRNIDLTLDTGASVTTLSKDILYQLGYDFEFKNKRRITTASGVEFVNKLELEKIKIGDFELNDIEVYAHTFPEESFSLGVLGLNILSQFDIELLFSKKEVILKKFD